MVRPLGPFGDGGHVPLHLLQPFGLAVRGQEVDGVEDHGHLPGEAEGVVAVGVAARLALDHLGGDRHPVPVQEVDQVLHPFDRLGAVEEGLRALGIEEVAPGVPEPGGVDVLVQAGLEAVLPEAAVGGGAGQAARGVQEGVPGPGVVRQLAPGALEEGLVVVHHVGPEVDRHPRLLAPELVGVDDGVVVVGQLEGLVPAEVAVYLAHHPLGEEGGDEVLARPHQVGGVSPHGLGDVLGVVPAPGGLGGDRDSRILLLELPRQAGEDVRVGVLAQVGEADGPLQRPRLGASLCAARATSGAPAAGAGSGQDAQGGQQPPADEPAAGDSLALSGRTLRHLLFSLVGVVLMPNHARSGRQGAALTSSPDDSIYSIAGDCVPRAPAAFPGKPPRCLPQGAPRASAQVI